MTVRYYSPILQKLPLKDETSGSLFNILLCKSLVISTYCRDHSHLINILPTNVPCQIAVDLLVILSIPGLLQECTLVDGESNEGPLTSLLMIGPQSCSRDTICVLWSFNVNTWHPTGHPFVSCKSHVHSISLVYRPYSTFSDNQFHIPWHLAWAMMSNCYESFVDPKFDPTP